MKKLAILAAAAAIVALFALPAGAQFPPSPPQITIQIVATPPPPIRREIRVAAPAPDVVWSSGNWDWRGGQWVWVDGSWVRPPAPGAGRVRAEYMPVEGGYRYIPAHWSTERVVEAENGKVTHDNGKHKGWNKKEKKHKHHDED
jgi:hypothetical protein